MDKKVIIGLFATLLILVAIIYFSQSLNNKNSENIKAEINNEPSVNKEIPEPEEIILDNNLVIMNNVQNELQKLIQASSETRMQDGNYANIYDNENFVSVILGIKEIDQENMHPFSVISDDNINFCVSVEYMGDTRCVDSNGYLGASSDCSENNYLCTPLQLSNIEEDLPLNIENEILIEEGLPILPEEVNQPIIEEEVEIDLPSNLLPEEEPPLLPMEIEQPITIEEAVLPPVQEIEEPEVELTFEEKENIMVLEVNLKRMLDSNGMQWIYIDEKEYGPYENAYIYHTEDKWGVANIWNGKWYVNINNKVYGPYVSKPEIELYDNNLGFYYLDNGKWFININGEKYGPYNNLNEVDFDQIL